MDKMNISRLCAVLQYGRVFLNKPHTKKSFSFRYQENYLRHNNIRLVSTYEVKEIQKKESLVKKLLKKIPFLNVDRVTTRASAYLLYENIADKINYIEYFEKFDLPDTFYSWFVITELHIWMISARAMTEGDQGKFLRNCMVEALWADVAQRVKKLGAANPSATRAQVSELSEQLQASLIAYDEGLQSDDVVLAGALWRRLYQMKYAAPQHLEELVKYIRQHITLLDNLSKEQILKVKPVRWELR